VEFESTNKILLNFDVYQVQLKFFFLHTATVKVISLDIQARFYFTVPHLAKLKESTVYQQVTRQYMIKQLYDLQ